MLREGGAGGIGAAEPLHGQASRYGGGRIYTRCALRGLAHIYALRAHHGEEQGNKELGRQSRCKDKLRATRVGAYIRASRYEGWRIYTRFARTTGLGGAGGKIGAAEPLQGQASRYGGWRIYTRFAP